MELLECYWLLEIVVLIYDIGNFFFGYFGEEVICIWFEKNGFLYVCWFDFLE